MFKINITAFNNGANLMVMKDILITRVFEYKSKFQSSPVWQMSQVLPFLFFEGFPNTSFITIKLAPLLKAVTLILNI